MKPPFRRTHTRQQATLPEDGSGRRHNLAPFFIFGAFALLIASQEIPWLHDRLESLLHPEAFAALQQCREAALRQSPAPEFARTVRGGKAIATEGGFVVQGLVIGEPDPEQGEQQVAITCHVDAQGTLARLHREVLGKTTTESGQTAHNLSETRQGSLKPR